MLTESKLLFPDRRPKVFYQLSGWMGDQVYASAVVANIVAAGFAINVDSHAHEALWSDCPLLTREITAENADFNIREHFPYRWDFNAPFIIEGVTAYAAKMLSADIPVLVKKPHIWMKLSKKRIIESPYVLILTGWQNSAPTKKWAFQYWNELIDRFPEVTFVQAGQTKNHAIPLDNTINMIDKTSIQDLARLVRDAICVISRPSGIVHLAAAYYIPTIMLSGGREPAQMISYPNIIPISLCGCMDCCMDGGCHRNHFGTGSNTCADHDYYMDEDTPTSTCMLKITPDRVAEELHKVLEANI